MSHFTAVQLYSEHVPVQASWCCRLVNAQWTNQARWSSCCCHLVNAIATTADGMQEVVLPTNMDGRLSEFKMY